MKIKIEFFPLCLSILRTFYWFRITFIDCHTNTRDHIKLMSNEYLIKLQCIYVCKQAKEINCELRMMEVSTSFHYIGDETACYGFSFVFFCVYIFKMCTHFRPVWAYEWCCGGGGICCNSWQTVEL